MSIYEYDEERHMRQTREEGYEEGYQQGEAIGRQQGEVFGKQLGMDRINQLNQILAEKNRTEDIVKAACDMDYQEKLLNEFGI